MDEPSTYLSITGAPLNLGNEDGFLGNCSSISCFERLNAVGEGAYGIVSRARDKRNGVIVALKQVRILDDERHNGIPLTAMREISILRSLKHQNVINVLEVAVDDRILEEVHMVMEYCEQDLACLIDEHTVQFSLSEVKCIAKQLLEGLEYLHRNDIIHRDVKLENLLLNAKGVLKIADFGMAREYAPRPLTPGVVTIWYRAPEILLGTANYTPSVDLWAAGLIIGELLLCMPVLTGETVLDQLSQVVKLIGSPSPEDIRNLSAIGCPDLIRWQREEMPRGRVDNIGRRFSSRSSKGTVSFLSGLLRWDPKTRWTASEALGKTRSRFAADAEVWWRESPRSADRESLPVFPDQRSRRQQSGDMACGAGDEEAGPTKRQLHEDEAYAEFGGYVFDFGQGEPTAKLPPRKRKK